MSQQATNNTPKNDAVKPLTASEALFAFAAWVTSLDATIIAGSKYDAAVWARLVDAFTKANGLEDPRPGWDDLIEHPDESTLELEKCEC
jgi:hypothetical protein